MRENRACAFWWFLWLRSGKVAGQDGSRFLE